MQGLFLVGTHEDRVGVLAFGAPLPRRVSRIPRVSGPCPALSTRRCPHGRMPWLTAYRQVSAKIYSNLGGAKQKGS